MPNAISDMPKRSRRVVAAQTRSSLPPTIPARERTSNPSDGILPSRMAFSRLSATSPEGRISSPRFPRRTRYSSASTNATRRITPSSRDSWPSRAKRVSKMMAPRGTTSTWDGTWAKRIGAMSAERPNANATATIAAPMIEPSAMPAAPSAEATAPTARLSGSKPTKMTLIKKAEIPKATEVPTTPLTSCSAKKMISPSPMPKETSAMISSIASAQLCPESRHASRPDHRPLQR